MFKVYFNDDVFLGNKTRKEDFIHNNGKVKIFTNEDLIPKENPKNPAQIAERAFHLAIASEIHRKEALADIFIEPSGLQDYGLFDLQKAKEIFQIGYEAGMEVL